MGQGLARLAYHRFVSRAPFQVVVIPFRRSATGEPEYAVFRRSDDSRWQPIAGGGEDGESAAEAARREAEEEAGLPPGTPMYRLQTMDTVPVCDFRDRESWPSDLYVVPQYSFAADATYARIAISPEHTSFGWMDYDDAAGRLDYQSNATALWELHERLKHGDLPERLGC